MYFSVYLSQDWDPLWEERSPRRGAPRGGAPGGTYVRWCSIRKMVCSINHTLVHTQEFHTNP